MSMQEVARVAGVSVATVSRVLNDPAKVGAETQARVNEAIRTLEYAPNASARSLRTQRSRVLGVVLPTLLNPVFAECLKGIADAAATAGHAILPFFTDYSVERESQAVNQLLASNVEGLVLVVSNPETSRALARLAEQRRPYVLAYNHHPHHPCVTVDGENAMAALIAHLAGLGHRRIAMVTGHLHVSDRAQQRSRGYRKGMEAAGLALVEVPFIDSPSVGASPDVGSHAVEADSSAEIVGRLLRRGDRPTALIGSNDLIAMRCMRAARLLGLRIPQDISIVGFDGIGLGAELFPRLATVAQPNEDIGRQCVLQLLRGVEQQALLSASAGVLLPHAFDAAESCGMSPSLHSFTP